MKVNCKILVGCLLLAYCFLFVYQECRIEIQKTDLAVALPVPFYKMLGGVGTHLISEMLFVKASVYLGNEKADHKSKKFEDAFTNNLEVMTKLYPRFLDPYYYTQAFLLPISSDSVYKTNSILQYGIDALPKNVFLRFFYGANLFMYMREYEKASEFFKEASKMPNAPQQFLRLSDILSSKKQRMAAELVSLKIMLQSEKNDLEGFVMKWKLKITSM
jgi:hypothetical protein